MVAVLGVEPRRSANQANMLLYIIRPGNMELSQRLELCYSIYRTDASPSMLGKQLEQVERIELPRTSFADSRLSTWPHPLWCSHRELNSDPMFKRHLRFRYAIGAWFWRRDSNSHHALIRGLRLIRPLHYQLCYASRKWRSRQESNLHLSGYGLLD